MQAFRQLRVWQKAHELTLEVYRVTARFPREETYALTSQIKRAAASIGANIAEGCGRGSDADFSRFLLMAMGSASELEPPSVGTRSEFLKRSGFRTSQRRNDRDQTNARFVA